MSVLIPHSGLINAKNGGRIKKIHYKYMHIVQSMNIVSFLQLLKIKTYHSFS